jgi:thiamine-monophosphate kinase
MGAETIGIIVSMGLPRNMLLDDFDQLVEGILYACKKYGMALIGGDTNESPEFTLCGTCLGMVEKKCVLMKGGARPGDIVAVTGTLGIAAAGFEVLFNQKSNKNIANLDHSIKELLLKHALEPEARLEEGILLGKSGAVTSATDITDGLLSEIGEIVDASENGIGIVIQEDQLPIPEEVIAVADITGKDPLQMAITYGEDFEILLTVDPTHFANLKSSVPLYEIGVVDSTGRITMIDKSGKTNIMTPNGYEHLK